MLFLWIVWNAKICKVLGHYKLLLECLEVRATQIEQTCYLLWWKMQETAIVLQFRVWIALLLLLLNFVGNVWYVNLQSNLFHKLKQRRSSRRQLHIILIHVLQRNFILLHGFFKSQKNGYLVTKRGAGGIQNLITSQSIDLFQHLMLGTEIEGWRNRNI